MQASFFIFCCFYAAFYFSTQSNAVVVVNHEQQQGTQPSDTETSDSARNRNELLGWDWDEMQTHWEQHHTTFNTSQQTNPSTFIRLNQKIGASPDIDGNYPDPAYIHQFIMQAALNEHRYPDQVIVYHGEQMGLWLFQVLARQLRYPHAKEWLPLRFDGGLGDVDGRALQAIIHKSITTTTNESNESKSTCYAQKSPSGRHDHSTAFTTVGLSAHVNLLSRNPKESASYVFYWWCSFGGCSTGFVASLMDSLEIPLKDHVPLMQRLVAVLFMIGWKGQWLVRKASSHTLDDFQAYFPSLTWTELRRIESWRKACIERPGVRKGVGVILQMVMPPELAIKYSYASGRFGVPKNQPILEFYRDHKNQRDQDGQVRVAMGYPFTRYPSPVKIRALSPIFQEHELMQMVQKMMKDITIWLKRYEKIKPLSHPLN